MERLKVLRRIVPEIVEMVERRYTILRNIYFTQPVGRRALAVRLGLPERTVRKEVELLKEQGLVMSDAAGMKTTAAAEEILTELKEYVKELRGLTSLERRLMERLGLEKVIVVPGNSDTDETVKKEMAKATAKYLTNVLKDGNILAVTGGTTLAEVARSFPSVQQRFNITVVPARGGLGEEVEMQANTVAATIAQHLGANYRLLHVPEGVSKEVMDSLASEPKIHELLELIKQADVVLHGIGTAEEMAKRRGLDAETMELLKRRGAVGEAFGYYFDRQGNIVYYTHSLGMGLENLAHVNCVIAVGGGTSKAEAALAVMSGGYQKVCITDEGAASEMLRLLNDNRSDLLDDA